MLRATGKFTEDEVQCALSIVDECLKDPNHKDYELYCAANGLPEPVGLVCYGKASLSDTAYDLYWLAVDPRFQRKGVGKLLLNFAEGNIMQAKAKMLLVETSSQPKYEGTRAFYSRNGYAEAARLRDYYRESDDKVILMKRFPC